MNFQMAYHVIGKSAPVHRFEEVRDLRDEFGNANINHFVVADMVEQQRVEVSVRRNVGDVRMVTKVATTTTTKNYCFVIDN